MDILPIRNDADHAAALREIKRLWNAPQGSDDASKLDILATMIERYEDTKWPIPDPNMDPVQALEYALGDMGHTQTELADLLGSRSRASEILARKRKLTVEMVYRIHQAWKLPLELLVKPYKISTPKKRARRTSRRNRSPRQKAA